MPAKPPYVLVMADGTYVWKGEGWNGFVRDPRMATTFNTWAEADSAKPGHHRDMGGSGFKGRIASAKNEIRTYEAWERRFARYHRR